MKEYFILQFRMLNRNLRAFGINPLAGCVLTIAILAGISFYLYTKTEFAPYIVALGAIAIMYPLNEERRLEFLKMIFKVRDVYMIRILENLVIAIPFMIFLVFKRSFPAGLGLFIVQQVLIGTNLYHATSHSYIRSS